jgi:hypothetical protein
MKKKVLIASGSGLIGRRLTEILLEKNYDVAWLSRAAGTDKVKRYTWDIKQNKIDEEAVRNADIIVNLAGTNVFEEKWSKSFKKEILESRTQSVKLLHDALKIFNPKLKVFISASAIGYYGADTGDKLIDENSSAGKDFLAEVVKEWEKEIDKIMSLNIRTVIFRIGIVLSANGGALEKLTGMIKKGTGAVVGSGKQYVSWIHIDDICQMIMKAIEDDNIGGIYNAVAPAPVTNEELTKSIASQMGKSISLPKAPAFSLKLMLGSEKAEVLLGGSKVSSEKIQKKGFQFKFSELKDALSDLIK